MTYHIPQLIFAPISQMNQKQYNDIYQQYSVFESQSHRIRIVIYPSWLEEYSYPRKGLYSWLYHVRIENHDINPIYILQKNWDIIQRNSTIKKINTKIVSSDIPKLNSGEACNYTDCITLESASNIIKGYYSISNNAGHIINIDIPTFTLDNPHDLFSIN